MRNLIIIIGCLITFSAQADWQFTKWGMTPEQVIAASGNKYEIDPEPTDPSVMLKKGDYEAGEYEFDIEFKFRANRQLAVVVLTIKNEGQQALCHDLSKDIKKKYKNGYLRNQDTPPFVSLAWYGSKPDNLAIGYLNAGFGGNQQSCSLVYKPYADVANTMKKADERKAKAL